MQYNHKTLLFALIIITFRFYEMNLFAQPQIEWYRTYNSPTNTDDIAASIAIDSSGNIITFGWIYDIGSNGGYIVHKYTPAGQLLWTGRYFETSGFPLVAKKVAVDALNNIYVTGYKESIVTVKFNSLGILQWVRKYRGSGSFLSEPHDMEIDRNGFIYVTGESSEPFPSSFDYVTIKYNSSGDSLWTRKYNGPDGRTDQAQALEVDSTGNVYVTGGSYSLHDTNYFPDITTIKYNSSGNTLWVNRYYQNNSKNGIGYDLAVDQIGNSYITGFIEDANFNANICNIKYDNNGLILWVRTIDGGVNLYDSGYKVKTDKNGFLYISGETNPILNSFSYYFVLKYDNNGTQQWIKNYRDTLNGIFEDMTLDKYSNIYITGGMNTIKYDNSGNLIWANQNFLNDSTYVGKSLALDASKNIYLVGNLGDNIITIKYNQPIGIQPISNEIPNQFSLSQNYPNPFNPETKIQFEIPFKSNVNIAIFDILGRQIETLLNKELSAGKYNIDFDGNKYSSGIYFYNMRSGNFSETKKMILIK